MYTVLASNPLASTGQIAAIVLLLEELIVVLISLALAAALLLGLAWVRQKAELIKKIRPVVNTVNVTAESAIKGELPTPIENAGTVEKISRTAAQVPRYAHIAEQKVEQGSDQVAKVVIEVRARTVMVTSTLKAFFLPGLTQKQEAMPLPIWEDSAKQLADGHRPDMVSISETHVVEGESTAEPVISGQAPRP